MIQVDLEPGMVRWRDKWVGSAVTLVSCSTARRLRLLCTALGKSTLSFLSSSMGETILGVFFLALLLTAY